jgi:hypothetical protein
VSVLAGFGAKSDIDGFLEAAAKLPAASDSGRGRLSFALDVTMSRQATWDFAFNSPPVAVGEENETFCKRLH